MTPTTAAVSGALAETPPNVGSVGRPSPGRDRAYLLQTLDSIFHGRRVAHYVSTPITTGERLFRWHVKQRSADHTMRPDRHSILASIREDNVSAARIVVERLDSMSDAPVIDPTRLEDVPGWEQSDYHEFWLETIRRFVMRMTMVDGWQYSAGCSLEFAAAAEKSIETTDQHLRIISVMSGAIQIARALDALASVGLDTRAHREAMSQLRPFTTDQPLD